MAATREEEISEILAEISTAMKRAVDGFAHLEQILTGSSSPLSTGSDAS
jgi:hypothetical protein